MAIILFRLYYANDPSRLAYVRRNGDRSYYLFYMVLLRLQAMLTRHSSLWGHQRYWHRNTDPINILNLSRR